MKTYVSIFIALLSIIITSQTSDNGDLAMPCGYCGAYGYYLQECTCANEFPLEALAAECNIPIQQVPEGKSGGHPFSKHNIRQNEITNKCGQHLHSIGMLHNSLPAITVSHRHIFLLGRLII